MVYAQSCVLVLILTVATRVAGFVSPSHPPIKRHSRTFDEASRSSVQLCGWFNFLEPKAEDDGEKSNDDNKGINDVEVDDRDPVEKMFNFFFGDVEENPQGEFA